MSIENPLWGPPRIHGELLKLGFEVAQSSVAKYMVKRRRPPSQGWRTFLRNRRDMVWINVTANPTAEWVARQITEAFPWDDAPKYLIRDRDQIYGAVVTRRLRAMGIRDKPAAPASPWQNGFAERPIGSIRRECLDHIIVLSEAHLPRILIARFSGPEASSRTPSLAGCITITCGFRGFQYTQVDATALGPHRPRIRLVKLFTSRDASRDRMLLARGRQREYRP